MTTTRESTPYGPSGMQARSRCAAFSLPPALSSSLGNGTRGHPSPGTGHSFAMSLSPAARAPSPASGAAAPTRLPPLGSAAVGAAGPASESPRAPARRWDTGSTCDFAFGGSASPAAPRAGSGCVRGAEKPGAPGGHPAGGDPRTRGWAAGAPTHVALQFPLGGRLDEPAGAHSVACAHRGRRRRRRPFLQLGRPPSAGGSRARDSDGAGPAPARPPSAAPCGPATPASGRSPSAPPPRPGDGRHRPRRESAGEAGGRAPGAPSSKSPGEWPVAGPPDSARKEPLDLKRAQRGTVPRALAPTRDQSRQKGWSRGLAVPKA